MESAVNLQHAWQLNTQQSRKTTFYVLISCIYVLHIMHVLSQKIWIIKLMHIESEGLLNKDIELDTFSAQ